MRGNNWDIFCHVVDNFGDVGVCWRLARQLVAEHGLRVRLWVDNLCNLHQLCPDIQVTSATQFHDGLEIHDWANSTPDAENVHVVIEAFGCELPNSYVAAMAACDPKPVWINLEYLTAEPWIDTCHRQPSPHPQWPLVKHFFFPGFVEASGGLLREAKLTPRRDTFQRTPAAGWSELGLVPSSHEELSVSMFCYENSALSALFKCWSEGETPIRCLIPEGKALIQAGDALRQANLRKGDTMRIGNLYVCALPFLSQEAYDCLLWSCDLNFVRGEDSFVRAQWATKPMVWQIYPQEDGAHLAKLEAFLALYCEGMAPDAVAECRALWLGWNHVAGFDIALAWPAYLKQQSALRRQSSEWSRHLAMQADLSFQLVEFAKSLL